MITKRKYDFVKGVERIKMKTKEAKLKILIKYFYNKETNTVNLSGLDFGDMNVTLSNVKANCITNQFQKAGKLFNDYQEADYIGNRNQEGNNIINDDQKADNIYNSDQEAKYIRNNGQIATRYISNEFQEAKDKIDNSFQEAILTIYNNYQEADEIDNSDQKITDFCKECGRNKNESM